MAEKKFKLEEIFSLSGKEFNAAHDTADLLMSFIVSADKNLEANVPLRNVILELSCVISKVISPEYFTDDSDERLLLHKYEDIVKESKAKFDDLNANAMGEADG